jgi:hypothetical protein
LRRIWKADLFLLGICSVFFLAGIVVLLLGIFAQLTTQDRLIVCSLGLVVTLIFGTVIGIVKTLERRRFRLFSHGRILHGRIESIQESPWVNGNQRVYTAHFQIGDDVRGNMGSAKIQGIPAEQARRFAETGETIRILQDRDVQDRYLLADCYSVMEGS